MEIVLFNYPFLLIIFIAALLLMVLDIFIKKCNWIIKIVYGLIFVTGIILSLLYGASFQELLIVTLFFVNVSLFYFFFRRKENKIE